MSTGRLGGSPSYRSGRRDDLRWIAALFVTLLLAALVPLVWEGRFYYTGDTQVAYLGWWYELGDQLRSGHWPLLDVQTWRAGNALAEGQWGLFSPLTIVIGLLASTVSNVLVFSTAVKVFFVVVSGLGTYALTRSYRVPPAAGYVAGVVVPFCGQSHYGDSTSWANGLMASALLPWAWWAIRRVVGAGANPFPALVLCYLLVTIGYVYGTLYLVVVIVSTLVECWLARNRAGLVKALLIGACSGLVAVAVYLPGVLTAPVTLRGSWQIVGVGIWTVYLETLFTSVLPVSVVNAGPSPYRYLAWVLPVVAWVDASRVRARLREVSSLIVASGVMVAWVLGPDTLGPIRWPVRVEPALVLPVVVLVVVLLFRTTHRSPSALRLALSLGWVLVAWWIVTSRLGDLSVAVSVGATVVVAGLGFFWLALRLGEPGLAALSVGACTLALLVTQHYYFPDAPSADRNLPARTADYRVQLSTAVGDAIAVGSPEHSWRTDPSTGDEILMGSTWYLNPHTIQSTGTAIGFKAYSDRFCMPANGTTCPEALRRLFQREPETGKRWVDLMSVSTILLHRQGYPGMRVLDPPSGWRVSAEGHTSLTWVREVPLPTAGGSVWSSRGTRVTDLTSADRKLSFRVDDVPASGGTVVLSRLAWPGYHVDGGVLGSPVEDMLLTVQVPAHAAGHVVTVSFTPPGWRLEMACWWLGVLVSLGWSVLFVVTRRRRGRSRHGTGRPRPVEPGSAGADRDPALTR